MKLWAAKPVVTKEPVPNTHTTDDLHRVAYCSGASVVFITGWRSAISFAEVISAVVLCVAPWSPFPAPLLMIVHLGLIAILAGRKPVDKEALARMGRCERRDLDQVLNKTEILSFPVSN